MGVSDGPVDASPDDRAAGPAGSGAASDHPPEDAATEDGERSAARSCAVDGCPRPGTVPRKLRRPGTDEPIRRQYVCAVHHRLFVGIRLALVLALLLLVGYGFFRL